MTVHWLGRTKPLSVGLPFRCLYVSIKSRELRGILMHQIFWGRRLSCERRQFTEIFSSLRFRYLPKLRKTTIVSSTVIRTLCKPSFDLYGGRGRIWTHGTHRPPVFKTSICNMSPSPALAYELYCWPRYFEVISDFLLSNFLFKEIFYLNY